MITDILPQPVKVSLAGKEYTVSELTLNDMAQLQEWVRSRVPHPLAAVKEHLAGLEPAERRMLLEKAYEAADEWPPRMGTPEFTNVIMSQAGLVFQVQLIIKKHLPGFTIEEAKVLSDQMSASELDLLHKTAMNVKPTDEIEREGAGPKA
jgi:hypothetical protein